MISTTISALNEINEYKNKKPSHLYETAFCNRTSLVPWILLQCSTSIYLAI
jgi:hypothetical protein